MAVFIELTSDPFEETLAQQRANRRGGNGTVDAGRVTARRPTRGLEIKEDRPASIKIIQADGTELPLVDSGSSTGESQSYTNFILQSVTEARMEKSQIVETFGDSYIYFFGEAPRFLDVQAVLINSLDFNWEAEWWENYENNLRGTKLVERGARMYLFYDDNVVEGFMLNCQAVKSSDQPFLVQMNFRVFVTNLKNITFVGDPAYPTRASAVLPDSLDLRDPNSRFDLFSNQQGQNRDDALADNAFDSQALYSQSTEDLDPLYQQGALTRLLRSAPRTAAFPANIVASLEQQGIQAIRAAVGNTAIRGLISDNTDEYIGDPRNNVTNELGVALPSAQSATIRTTQEVEDLWVAAINALSCYGVDINNTKSLVDMNLMPRFSAGASKSATFTPSAGVSFGVGLTDARQQNAQLAKLQAQLSPSINANVSIGALGAVFGSGSSSTMIDRSTVQGGGDREYGYSSSYAAGAGFGKPGFGDFGGNGFGSGQGIGGDPGFKSPASFSFSGVSEASAAFNQFNSPTSNNTVFNSTSINAAGRIGLSASTAGLSGGAATRILGQLSVFSITSIPGTLDPTGTSAGAAFGVSTGCTPAFEE